MSNFGPPSHTGGVKPMSIAGRMVRERERLQGMTDAERAWRAQWLKDQVLAPEEPVIPPNYYKERYNPIRRFYRAPMEMFENAIRPRVGPTGATFIRHAISKTVLTIFGVYCIWYHMKYNRGDWTKKSSWKVTENRAIMYPNDPGYPNYKTPKDDDYASFGFKDSPI